MVKEIDSETVIATAQTTQIAQPSFKRWLKHVFYFKSSRKLFDAAQKQQIADAIQQAENGHRGEIQIIVEGSLPAHLAYEVDSKQRAEQLFAEYKVWDTEYNSGILIYLNLCDHAVEIVADRGVDQAVTDDCWNNICQSMLPYFKQQQFSEGLIVAIAELGEIFSQFYQAQPDDPKGNELTNEPRLI